MHRPMSWILSLTLESEALIGCRFDSVRANGILGITLGMGQNELVQVAPCQLLAEGGFSGAPPQLGQVEHLSIELILGCHVNLHCIR